MPERTLEFRAMEDRELVIAFKAGDPDAYDEMYRRYSARVGSVCRRMLTNREDAQEATQETFLKAYLALPEFNGNYRLGAWLGRIASNVCVDLLRARARSASLVQLQPEAGILAVESSPEDVVVGDAPEVAEQMDGMQPLHARALMLRGVEGMSHREIAGTLSMTPAQVKALLHRARRSFKRTWEGARGWALAPVVLLRGASRQLRASQTGSQIAGASAGFSPMIAERVAASAVIVAVALTGLPSSTISSPAEGHNSLRRSPQTSQWEMSEPRASIRPRQQPARAHTARRSSSAESVRSGQELVAGLQKVLTRAQGAVGHPPKKRTEESGGDDLIPTGPKAVQATAERIVEDVQDLVPDP